jgi:hypothetical protein
MNDVTELLKHLPSFQYMNLEVKGHAFQDAWPPTVTADVEVTLTVTPWPPEALGAAGPHSFALKDLVLACLQVEDGHVMAESVDLASEYTGKRDRRGRDDA